MDAASRLTLKLFYLLLLCHPSVFGITVLAVCIPLVFLHRVNPSNIVLAMCIFSEHFLAFQYVLTL